MSTTPQPQLVEIELDQEAYDDALNARPEAYMEAYKATTSWTGEAKRGQRSSGEEDRKKRMTMSIGYACTADGLYYGVPGVADRLEPGFYSCVQTNSGPGFKRIMIKTDDLIDLADPTSAMLLDEVRRFWAGARELDRRGLAVKRGHLFFGPPGSGKTSIISRICAHVINEMGGVVVLADNPNMCANSMQLLRAVEPERPVVLVYEDIDAMMERGDAVEASLLALLDGELQVGGVIHVATTNYPEKLDKRFTDRPGRFDRITFVPPPSETSRLRYFQDKAPDRVADHARWVEVSKGWSIAHLRELVVATTVLGEDDGEVIKRLREMKDRKWETDGPASRLGFETEPQSR